MFKFHYNDNYYGALGLDPKGSSDLRHSSDLGHSDRSFHSSDLRHKAFPEQVNTEEVPSLLFSYLWICGILPICGSAAFFRYLSSAAVLDLFRSTVFLIYLIKSTPFKLGYLSPHGSSECLGIFDLSLQICAAPCDISALRRC